MADHSGLYRITGMTVNRRLLEQIREFSGGRLRSIPTMGITVVESDHIPEGFIVCQAGLDLIVLDCRPRELE